MKGVLKIFGGTLSCLLAIPLTAWALYALFLQLEIAVEATGWGIWAVIAGLIFFPLTFTAAPIYALIAWGDAYPLIVTYGGVAAIIALMVIAAAVTFLVAKLFKIDIE